MSSSNPRVQRLRRLIGRRSVRYEENLFVIEGSTLVAEAHACGVRVIEQYVREDHPDEPARGVVTYELDARTFNSVADTISPQGVLAICEMPTGQPRSIDEAEWLLVLHEISDPGNMGTLIRSAEAAGVAAIVLVGSTVDPWSPKVVRASAGSLFHVPIWRVRSLGDLRALGAQVIGTTSHPEAVQGACDSLYDAVVSGPVAMVLGNEAHGLDNNADVDRWISIPHEGRSESLNVAMAGTVLAMHISHVRRSAQG